jgi:hypothetical protein
LTDTSAALRCVIIPADTAQPMHADTVDAAAVVRIVNGQPGIVLLDGVPAFLYTNENARFTGASANPRATRLIDRYVPGYANLDMVMGDAVLLGLDADGMDAPLPTDIETATLAGV